MENTKKFKNEEERKKIFDRIKKILALANGSSFEGEADTAMKMAQSYMTQYGLSMTDLEVSEELNEAIVNEFTEKTYPEHWEWMLALAISTITDTKAYIGHGKDRKSRIAFIGYKSDVEFSKVLFDMLRTGVNSSAFATFKGKEVGPIYLQRKSFKLGCAKRVYERSKEEKQKTVVAEGNNRFSLVVIAKAKHVDLWAQQNLRLRSSSSRASEINQEGYSAGQSHANKMDLMNRGKVAKQGTLSLGYRS